MPQENIENHQNIRISLENYEIYENIEFPMRIIKSKNLKILCKNNENHWDLRSPREIHKKLWKNRIQLENNENHKTY